MTAGDWLVIVALAAIGGTVFGWILHSVGTLGAIKSTKETYSLIAERIEKELATVGEDRDRSAARRIAFAVRRWSV